MLPAQPCPCSANRHARLVDAGPLLRLAAQQGGHQGMQLRAALLRQGRVRAPQDLRESSRGAIAVLASRWGRQGLPCGQPCFEAGACSVVQSLSGPPTLTAMADTELPRKGRCSVASSYSTQPDKKDWGSSRFTDTQRRRATGSGTGAAPAAPGTMPSPAAQTSAFLE